MPQAQSYSLVKPLSPAGTVIGDVSYIVPRRMPVVLKNVGDVVDLTRVDVNQFNHSALNGALRNLTVTAVLATVLVDVSEELENKFAGNLRGLMGGKDVHGAQGTGQQVSLEPGVGVWVGNAPESAHQKVTVLPAPVQVPATEEIEPGVQVPTAAHAEEPAQVPASPPVEDPQTAGATNWKDNLALGEQKKTLTGSTNKVFLNTVATSAEEPATLRNIAKNRLKELG